MGEPSFRVRSSTPPLVMDECVKNLCIYTPTLTPMIGLDIPGYLFTQLLNFFLLFRIFLDDLLTVSLSEVGKSCMKNLPKCRERKLTKLLTCLSIDIWNINTMLL